MKTWILGRLFGALAAAGMVAVGTSSAQTVQWPVTPVRMEFSNFMFGVVTQPTNGGTAFHIVITSKTEPIQPDTVALLASVTGSGPKIAVANLSPAVPVAIHRADRVWTADFVATDAVVNNPFACFVFVVTDYRTRPDGTRVYLTTDRMYEIRPKDFLNVKPAGGI